MVYYERNLPHYHPDNAIFFVTFRLTDSIPIVLLETLRKEYESEKKKLIIICNNLENYRLSLYDLQKKYFGKYDSLLDSLRYGPSWLANNDIANCITKKLHELKVSKYELITYTLLPNHVHLVFLPNRNLRVSKNNIRGKTRNYVISDTLRLIKGSTAREANKILGRTGQFWHHESFDHVVRDESELDRIIKYVLNNPVKAGIAKSWKDWKWNYSIYNPLTV